MKGRVARPLSFLPHKQEFLLYRPSPALMLGAIRIRNAPGYRLMASRISMKGAAASPSNPPTARRGFPYDPPLDHLVICNTV